MSSPVWNSISPSQDAPPHAANTHVDIINEWGPGPLRYCADPMPQGPNAQRPGVQQLSSKHWLPEGLGKQ